MRARPDLYVTPNEKAEFEENGYHIVRGALTPEEVQTYRDAMERLFATPADHPYLSRLTCATIPEAQRDPLNPRAIWNGFDLPLFDDLFYDLIFHPRIALTMDALIGPDLNFYETCFVTKPPRFPGHFRDWHQDSAYFDPQSNDRNAHQAETTSRTTGQPRPSHASRLSRMFAGATSGSAFTATSSA